MNTMTILSWVAIATMLGGAAWAVPALRLRRLRDPLRVHLCGSLLLLGIGSMISRPTVAKVLDRAVGHGAAKLSYNVLILVGMCLMVAFMRERPIITWRSGLQWEVVLCAVSILGMVAAMSAVAPASRNFQLTDPYLDQRAVQAFYDIGSGYLMVGYAVCAILAWRHARRGDKTMSAPLRIIGIGLVGLAVSCALRLLWVNVPQLRAPERTLRYEDDRAFASCATIVVCIGMSMSCVMSVAAIIRDTATQRRYYRGLEELWRRAVSVYPDVVLSATAPRRVLLPTDYALQTYRRYVECRDGLLRLRPHLTPAAATLGVPLPLDLTAGQRPEVIAAVLHIALGRAQAGEPDREPPPTVQTFVGTTSSPAYGEDLAALVSISMSLRSAPLRATRRPGSHPSDWDAPAHGVRTILPR